ncbi:MAG TPA: DUF937 domain-containing protein [Caulobacteraceae bacterium]
MTVEQPNVVDIVDEALSADLVDRIGERAGAPQEARGPAVKAAVPGVFQALGRRARDPAGAAEIVGAIRETSPAATLNEPVRVVEADPPPANATAERVLGSERGPLVARVAEHSGAEPEAAAAVVSMVTPLALGALARTVSVPLGQENLVRLFRDQQGAIDRADPFHVPTTGAAMHDATPGGRRNKKNTLWAWLIGLALLAILFIALRSCGLGGEEQAAETTLAPSGAAGETTTATVTPPGTAADPAVAPPAPAAPPESAGTPVQPAEATPPAG